MTAADNADEDSISESEATQCLAAPEQLLAGMEVGLPALDVRCSRCGTQLGEGDSVSVYAYRPAETPRWYLGRCCCLDCAPDQLRTPTLGTAECRVTARLAIVSNVGSQTHRLCLADPTLTSFAEPKNGGP